MLNVNSSFLANVSGQWSIQQQPPRWFGGVFRKPSLPPEVLEPVRRKRRVHRGAGDRPVPQPTLNNPGVVARVASRR